MTATIIPMDPVPLLIRQAQALEEKAVQASDKANQYWKSFGLTLKELKTCDRDVSWAAFVEHTYASRSALWL